DTKSYGFALTADSVPGGQGGGAPLLLFLHPKRIERAGASREGGASAAERRVSGPGAKRSTPRGTPRTRCPGPSQGRVLCPEAGVSSTADRSRDQTRPTAACSRSRRR